MADSLNIHRRAFLGAIPAVAAAAAVPGVALAATADRNAWDAAMRAYQVAKAEEEAFTDHYDDLWNRCNKACDSIPHVTFRRDPYLGPLFREAPSTANDTYVRQARKRVAEVDAGRCWLDPAYPELMEHLALCREVVKAADERDSAVQAVRDRFGMDAADERAEALGEAYNEAESALMATPAPDLAALRWKLDQIIEVEEDGFTPGFSKAYVSQTIADYQRLLGEPA